MVREGAAAEGPADPTRRQGHDEDPEGEDDGDLENPQVGDHPGQVKPNKEVSRSVNAQGNAEKGNEPGNYNLYLPTGIWTG